MTDPSAANNNVAVENDAGVASAPAENASREQGSPPETAAAPGPDPAALAREAAEHKDKMLRTLAEMENLRRRTEREVADARTYAVANFARDLLGVADNMQRALESAREGGAGASGVSTAGGLSVFSSSSAGGGGIAKVLFDGVELTERELLKVLEKHGVKRFDPQGAKFDPNLHQAIFEVPDPNVPAGSVVQVVQPGYMIGERVLRPAMVGVSKGGPKAAPPERSAEETQSG
jgi:molecular chaperone GrpE